MFVVDLTLLGSFQFEHPSVGSTTSHDNRNLWSCKQTLLWLVTKQMKPYHASPLWFDAQIKVHGTLAVAFFSPIMAARWPLFFFFQFVHVWTMHASFSCCFFPENRDPSLTLYFCRVMRSRFQMISCRPSASQSNIYPGRPKGSDR